MYRKVSGLDRMLFDLLECRINHLCASWNKKFIELVAGDTLYASAACNYSWSDPISGI